MKYFSLIIHVRIFDSLGAGILPLCEHSRDLDILFNGIQYPVIKNYSEISEITDYYLTNENERKIIVDKMKHRIMEKYSPGMVIVRLINKVFEL